MRIVLIGSFGSSGDQHYRVHQPAAALAALPGVEVFEVHPDARYRDAAALAADLLVLKDSDQNIKTTLLNINRDDLITYQPDLI